MIDIPGMLSLQGELFLLLALGILFKRRGILDDGFQRGLTDLVMFLVLPCNIIESFQIGLDGDTLRETWMILAVSSVLQIGCWVVAMVAFHRCAPDRKPVLRYASICSNAGFLGTPLAEGLFGSPGALLAAVYLTPQRIAMWTLGVSFFTKVDGKSTWKKAATHPCILAVAFGMVLMFTGLRLPFMLEQTIHALGTCNTGLSMFLIGMIMANLHLRDFLDRDILYYSAVRLFLIPLLVFWGCRLMGVEGLAMAVSVLLAAMPAGGITAVMAAKYGGNAEFAAGCITVSTLLSLLTTPLWCLLF